MLHGTICNDNFLRNTAEKCCNHSKQFRNYVEMKCYFKNRRCKSSRVKSPLVRARPCAPSKGNVSPRGL